MSNHRSVLVLLGLLVISTLACAVEESPPVEESPSDEAGNLEQMGFAVSALSRGKGVPPEAMNSLREIQELLAKDSAAGKLLQLETIRLGIEGERRVCVVYKDKSVGAAAKKKIERIVQGVDLMQFEQSGCTTDEADPLRSGNGGQPK